MSNLSVLLVEDDQDLKELAQELLAEEGFTVQLASTGGEVLRLLGEGFRPDCILLDLGLPDMTAADFLTEFSKIPGAMDLPIALVSGNAELGEWATRFNADRIISKPYGIESLVDTVTALCGLDRSRLIRAASSLSHSVNT